MSHFKLLYEQLGKLNEALGELDKLVLQEREDITVLNVAGLEAHRSAMESVFINARRLSEQVGLQIRTACDLSGVTGEKGLKPLILIIPKPEQGMFEKLRQSIHVVSAKIENELAVNRALLEDSLAFTSQSLQMFVGMLKNCNSNTYGQAGRFIETSDRPRIICKEI